MNKLKLTFIVIAILFSTLSNAQSFGLEAKEEFNYKTLSNDIDNYFFAKVKYQSESASVIAVYKLTTHEIKSGCKLITKINLNKTLTLQGSVKFSTKKIKEIDLSLEKKFKSNTLDIQLTLGIANTQLKQNMIHASILLDL